MAVLEREPVDAGREGAGRNRKLHLDDSMAGAQFGQLGEVATQ